MENRNVSGNTKLFVGGLAWAVKDGQLRALFEEHCGKDNVIEASVVNDRESGRSRGFGFVTVANEAAADEAIQKINGISYEGRTLKVDKADDKGGRSDRGNGGFKGRGGSRW